MLENHMILVGREGVEPPNGVPELIYSQRPLATWIPARVLIADCGLPVFPIKKSAINNHQSTIHEADDGNRTRNLPLTRRLLCRLSYVGGNGKEPV